MAQNATETPSSTNFANGDYPTDIAVVDLLSPGFWMDPGVIIFIGVAFIWILAARHQAQKNLKLLRTDVEAALTNIKQYETEFRSTLEQSQASSDRILEIQEESARLGQRQTELLEKQVASIGQIEEFLVKLGNRDRPSE